MIVTFQKCDNDAYRMQWQEGQRQTVFFNTHQKQCLEKTLCDHFALEDIRIIMKKTAHPGSIFKKVFIKFKKEEDEVFFLILSNDGLEI